MEPISSCSNAFHDKFELVFGSYVSSNEGYQIKTKRETSSQTVPTRKLHDQIKRNKVNVLELLNLLKVNNRDNRTTPSDVVPFLLSPNAFSETSNTLK